MSNLKKQIFLIILTLCLFLPNIFLPASALINQLNLDYPEIPIGNETYTLTASTDVNKVIAWFYYFIVIISGVSAFFMIISGGFTWLTSAGSPSKISDARDKITSAFVGLIIILGSWLILRIINPDLTTLQLPSL